MATGRLLRILFASTFLGISLVLASPHEGIKQLAAPTVNIKNGSISGIQLETYDQEAFFGIPYASNPPPRFGRSTPLNKSIDGFEATAYSVFCPGFGGDDEVLYSLGYKAGESCLTLNIVRPRGYESGANLPVGVWIYGGGFSNGGSPDRRYNTTWLVERSVQMDRPILTVTLNYRVSFFGFPNGQEVTNVHAQNLGLYDQQLALRWIQENIAAFGGDPSKVTIWGQSAGSQSVAYHILGQGGTTGKSLFRGGIMESGAASWNPMYTAGQAQAAFNAIAGNTSCANVSSSSVIDCLSSIPFTEFNSSAAMSKHSWQPTVDGDIIQDYPSKLLAAGKVAPVTIMHGCNTDDSSQAAPKGTNLTEDIVTQLYKAWPNITADTVTKLLELYPDDPTIGCPYDTGDGVLVSGLQDKRTNAIWTDVQQFAPRRLLSQTMVKARSNVYAWRYNQVTQNVTIDISKVHFSDVAYVFSNPLPTQNPLGNRPGDAELAKLMTSMWVSFIHDLTPNNHQLTGIPDWPTYDQKEQDFVFQRFDPYVEVDDYRSDQINYINSIGQYLSH